MAFPLESTGNGGNFLSFIKYNAKDGKFFRRDRTQDSFGNYDNTDVDITDGFTAAMDIKNIRVGYLDFSTGVPVKDLVYNSEIGKDGVEYPAKNTQNAKKGFGLLVILGRGVRGNDEDNQVREWTSNSTLVASAVSALDDDYLAGIAEDPKRAEQTPIVKLTNVEKVKSRMGTNAKPHFEIVDWIDDDGMAEAFGKGHDTLLSDGITAMTSNAGDVGADDDGGLPF